MGSIEQECNGGMAGAGCGGLAADSEESAQESECAALGYGSPAAAVPGLHREQVQPDSGGAGRAMGGAGGGKMEPE